MLLRMPIAANIQQLPHPAHSNIDVLFSVIRMHIHRSAHIWQMKVRALNFIQYLRAIPIAHIYDDDVHSLI